VAAATRLLPAPALGGGWRGGTFAGVVVSGAEWQWLRGAIGGEVVAEPGPATFNSRFHGKRARAVVRCRTPEDVAVVLSFVGRHDLPFVVRSGGHCFAGHSTTGGVVLDVGAMDRIRVDDGLATVGAGARLGAVYDRLQQDGLAIPAGTCPTVGIAGLALGGGLGVLGRRYGLTADRMVSAQVVLADGRVVVCNDDDEPDLFWALRGAGAGNFGVVTSFELRTVPAPRVVNFHLAWGFDAAAGAIDAWQGWAPTAPDELAASLKLLAPGDPSDPPTVHVYGALQVDGADRSYLIDELVDRIGVGPVWRWVEELDFAATRHLWAQLPPAGTTFRDIGPPADEMAHPWFVARSEFFPRPLPSRAVAGLLETFTDGRLAGEERELDFMPWGGAYNRVAADATAFAHRSELFQLKHSATAAPGALRARDSALAFVRRSWATVHRWGSGGVFPAFPDPELADAAQAYYGTNLPRLRRIKARYDPTGRFRLPEGQGITP